ncbi:MAG: hypothetical protein KBC30_04575 [Planctomycetes bacterium]|nr:hypothetical protein [Planctomycetota bacterium]
MKHSKIYNNKIPLQNFFTYLPNIFFYSVICSGEWKICSGEKSYHKEANLLGAKRVRAILLWEK